MKRETTDGILYQYRRIVHQLRICVALNHHEIQQQMGDRYDNKRVDTGNTMRLTTERGIQMMAKRERVSGTIQ